MEHATIESTLETEMTTLDQEEFTQPSIANRMSRFVLSSPVCFVALMVLCAFFVRAFVVLCVFVKIAAPSYDHGQFGAEMGWVARSLASGAGFSSPFFPATGPTALLPPLFPYLLAGVFHATGIYSQTSALVVLLLDSLLSALTCIPVYLSVQYVAGRRQAQFAGWLWALYPFAIYFSAAEVWDYSLTSLLFATCFCLAQRLHLQDRLSIWIGFGALYGVAALSNPAILSLLPFLLIKAIWKIRCGHGRRILLGAFCVLSFIAVVGPWTVRNYRVMNAASPIRDGFWLEFWAGNTGDTSESNPAWAHPASNPFEMQLFKAEGESVYLARKHALAMTSVHSHPLLFVGLSLRRAFRFWTGFWSFRSDYLLAEPFDVPNVFFCGIITLLMIRGLVRLWREDPSRALPYLMLVSIFPIPYYLTHSSMDYRQPIEPQIVVLVAIGILGINDRALSMRSRKMNTRAQLRGEPQFV